MKKLITICIFILMLASPTYAKTVATETINGYNLRITQHGDTTKVKWCGKTYRKYHHFRGKVKIVSEGKLTAKKLWTRKNKTLYIERIVGRVINNRLDGVSSNGGYINYSCLKGKAKKGDTIVTYCVYNPYTRWIDDISDRFDIIL